MSVFTRVSLGLFLSLLAGSGACSCDPSTSEGEGEGDAGEGEGEGDVGEGEGEGDVGEGEGEGDVGEGEGEGEGEGDIVDGSTVGITILALDTCQIVTTPASITVPAGTGFYARFTNLPSSIGPVDIDKIDTFNQVPLVIGLEPGQVFDDTIREWCGALFTGTFRFRIRACGDLDPGFLDVNCGG